MLVMHRCSGFVRNRYGSRGLVRCVLMRIVRMLGGLGSGGQKRGRLGSGGRKRSGMFVNSLMHLAWRGRVSRHMNEL